MLSDAARNLLGAILLLSALLMLLFTRKVHTVLVSREQRSAQRSVLARTKHGGQFAAFYTGYVRFFYAGFWFVLTLIVGLVGVKLLSSRTAWINGGAVKASAHYAAPELN